MKLILRVNCPTNEYWGVDFIQVHLSPADLAKLVRLRDRTVDYFKSLGEFYSGKDCYWGHCDYQSFLEFSVHDSSDNDVACDMLDRMDQAGVGEWLPLPEDFQPGESARTEVHSLMVFMDGTVWLRAQSKDGGDYVEAEFPLAELLKLQPEYQYAR